VYAGPQAVLGKKSLKKKMFEKKEFLRKKNFFSKFSKVRHEK